MVKPQCTLGRPSRQLSFPTPSTSLRGNEECTRHTVFSSFHCFQCTIVFSFRNPYLKHSLLVSLQYRDFQFPKSMIAVNPTRGEWAWWLMGRVTSFFLKTFFSTSFCSKLRMWRTSFPGKPGVLAFGNMALLGVWQLIRSTVRSPLLPMSGQKKKDIWKRSKKGLVSWKKSWVGEKQTRPCPF